MKRIYIILISLCAVISAYADDDVIEIWNKAQLETFRDAVNGGNTYSGKTVKLMADITIVSDDHWIPIGMSEQRWDEEHSAYVKDETCVFKGTFDGQGYTISITISTSVYPALGLFGYLHGIVQHLKVDGQFINTEESLTTCVGGIAGYNKGTISECANLAKIIGTTAGGIAGENNGTITNCYNRGNILATGDGEGTYYLGGIAGAFNGTAISNVYASCGKMDKAGTPGGIVSNNQSGTLSNCFYDVTWNGSTDKMTGSITLTGNALKASFDNDIWTFTDGELPELTCFKNKIVRLSDNNDNSDILTSYNNQTCTVELSGRTLYKDGKWNTLCLPFDVDDISSSPLAGATIKEMDEGTKLEGSLLKLKFKTATSIEAGKPYIIMWESGDDLTNVQFSGVTIKNTDPTTKAATFSSVCQFVGTYSPFSIGDTSNGTYDGDINEIILLSSGNKLGYSATTPRTLRSCRAHFMIPTTSSGIRAMEDFDIDFDGEATGITNTDLTDGTDDAWYTLQGVKLDGKPTQRGVYLHNGRKEAVR